MKLIKRGVTLVEMLVAITILLVAVIPLMKMFRDGLFGVHSFAARAKATNLAQELIEKVKSKKWDETTVVFGSATLAGTAVGLDGGGETAGNPNTFDDVDDFHGYSTSTLVGNILYNCSITVHYINMSGVLDISSTTQIRENVDLSSSGISDYKLIIASVTWKEGDKDKGPVLLKTMVSNYGKF